MIGEPVLVEGSAPRLLAHQRHAHAPVEHLTDEVEAEEFHAVDRFAAPVLGEALIDDEDRSPAVGALDGRLVRHAGDDGTGVGVRARTMSV
ncbi:MAG: hypothetical protein Tsb0013_17860 [Phycisphaerales bacterium]